MPFPRLTGPAQCQPSGFAEMKTKTFTVRLPLDFRWQIDAIWPVLWVCRDDYIQQAIRRDLIELWGSRGFGPVLRLARRRHASQVRPKLKRRASRPEARSNVR